MMSNLFYKYGGFCASHPWEVIVATLTITACMLTIDNQSHSTIALTNSTSYPSKFCTNCLWLNNNDTTKSKIFQSNTLENQYSAVDLIAMTIIRCIAILYSYYQFLSLHKLGSKYVLTVAGLFTMFSSFVFTSAVINIFNSDVTDLKDALFFFLLLIDISKIATLAQFAMNSLTKSDIQNNIAKGMALLGPSLTLDTLVETLVIGVGTLSGVRRLEMLSYYACLSVIVNYVVFMTLYPACLSFILELSHGGSEYMHIYNDVSQTFFPVPSINDSEESSHRPNLVVQRIKLIMSFGLMFVHLHSRWFIFGDTSSQTVPNDANDTVLNLKLNATSNDLFTIHDCIMRWITLSADHIVILILLLALTIKFLIFEQNEPRILNKIETKNSLVQTERRNSDLNDKLMKYLMKMNDKLTEDEVKTEITKAIKFIEPRCLNECIELFKSNQFNELTDDEVIILVKNKIIPSHKLEDTLKNFERGVDIRRQILAEQIELGGNRGVYEKMQGLPFQNYDYSLVFGQCCENVIGYMPIPLGFAGPLKLDNKLFYVPMATTEGCLVASTNRGCRALSFNGITSRVVGDGMTRGPVVRFPNLARASEAMEWIESPCNFEKIKESFNSTSRFARLQKVQIRIAGRYLFIRFVAHTGDAMGMNMVSKGTETSLKYIKGYFPDLEVLSLSGNFCCDKKPSAVNWIEGRGKSVVCEAIVPAKIISQILKTSVHALIDVNISKNLIGSAIAGTVGGFNAHAANIVTAVYIATGQDPAQNVGSSSCMTLMEPWGEYGEDLYITCTMPSIEIGTIGGGTILAAQTACLEMLGVKGANMENVGHNANQLAKIVCGTVLAGELSLMSALTAGHLVDSHLKFNRSQSQST